VEVRNDGVLAPELKDIRLEIQNNKALTSYYKIFIKNEDEEKFEFARPFIVDQSSILENSSFSAEVITNISNGAFGYWSGENSVSFKFQIPE